MGTTHSDRVPSPLSSMPVPEYLTTDPHLASFVFSQGAALLRAERPKPKRYRFWFAADERLHLLLQVYWSGQHAAVVPSRLFEALWQLKKQAQQHCYSSQPC
jgi:hypothetical protein